MYAANPNFGIQPFNPMADFQTALPQIAYPSDSGNTLLNDVPAYTGPDASSISSPSWIDKMMGYTDATTGMKSAGWGGMALGAAQGLGNLYMGMQQYGLAKKALQQSKEQFDKNYAAQRTTTNASLEDRQRARVASNPGAYQSVGDYMNQHGIR